MDTGKPIAVKHGDAALIYGVSAGMFFLATFILTVKIITEGGLFALLIIEDAIFLGIGGYFAYLTVKAARLPEVLIEEAEGGIRVMSRRPPLFIAATEIRGVRILRNRYLVTGRHSAPIAIRTDDREVVVYNVENVDGVHDRIVAIMTETAKKPD